MRRIALALALVALSCAGPLEQCEQDGTGDVTFSNGYQETLRITMNGVSYGILPAGQTKTYTVPSGSYTVAFTFNNDGSTACTSATIIVNECSDEAYVCPGS